MIRVNGEEKMLEEGTSLLGFLGQEGYQTARIAVEKNGESCLKAVMARLCFAMAMRWRL